MNVDNVFCSARYLRALRRGGSRSLRAEKTYINVHDLLGNEKGFSLIEILFGISVLVLVITGVMVMQLSTVKLKTKGGERDRAWELGELLMAGVGESRQVSPESFWTNQTLAGGTWPGYVGLTYDIEYEQVASGEYPNCNLTAGAVDCLQVRIEVNWPDNNDQPVRLNRFFSRFR